MKTVTIPSYQLTVGDIITRNGKDMTVTSVRKTQRSVIYKLDTQRGTNGMLQHRNHPITVTTDRILSGTGFLR
jgi:uncharacterized protein YqjF (DUF2071 family)